MKKNRKCDRITVGVSDNCVVFVNRFDARTVFIEEFCQQPENQRVLNSETPHQRAQAAWKKMSPQDQGPYKIQAKALRDSLTQYVEAYYQHKKTVVFGDPRTWLSRYPDMPYQVITIPGPSLLGCDVRVPTLQGI